MTYPYLPLAITEMYCVVFAATVWFRLNSSIGTEHEVKQLRNMIYSYIVMLASDILWAFMEDGIIHMPHVMIAFVNAVILIAVTCGCYFWFRFIEDRVHLVFTKRKMWNLLLMIPFLVICLLDFLSIFTKWFFYIDAAGHFQSTSWAVIHLIVNYFYLVIPTIISVYRAIKTRSKQERVEFITYAMYMIAPLVAGLLEDYFPHVPLLGLNIFMVILIMFLMIQNMQVYNDALTGLNNRRRLNQYLEDCLSKASEKRPVLLFIMDINNFKQINDMYGHIEGDNALKIFASILKEIASQNSAFVARYGGDEFCMVMNFAERDPEMIITDLRKNLRETQIKNTESNREYTFTVSVGFAICSAPESTPEHILAKADSMLYEDKGKWHRGQ